MKEKSGCGLKKNDLFELTIEDIGSEGEGIGKYDGFTFFVKDAVTGDRIQAQVLKVNKNYGFAKVVSILTPSPQRVEPVCPVARQCGGCQLQHVSYAEQLRYKADKVKNCLTRIGGISEPCMESILGMEEPFYYRNKAQFPVGRDRNGEPVIGFYAGRTHHIIATETCCIQAKLNRCLIKTFRAFLKKYAIAPYHEEDGTGLVRHVLTRIGFATGEVMVCPVINGNSMPHATELVEMLQQAVEQYRQEEQESTVYHLKSVCFNINKEKTNVILGERIVPFFGEPYITDYIGDVCFHISPLSFYQVNPIQTKVLYEQALTYAGLTGEETVWDLYCGIGTISLFLAGRAKKVYGVEIVPQAIADARENAKLNGIDNAEFFVGAAEEVLPEQYKKSGGTMRADVIVVDPPRKGCAESLLDTIVAMEPDRVVYVSCDPGTLARDVRYLSERGYRLVKARPVDQFPQGFHVETVVLLSQQKADDYIEVELELDELDLTSAESKATYKEIQEYVLKEHGLKVSNLYISQVKRKCGIEVGENYNLPKSEDSRQPQCPEEKEKAIKDALEHFGMI